MSHRRISPRLAAVVVAVAALVSPAGALAAAERPRTPGPPTTPSSGLVSERLIVVWESGTSATERVAARADADTALVRTLGAPRFQLVVPEAGQSVRDALAELRDDPAVLTAARDGYSVVHATTDPFYGELWGLRNLGFGVAGAGAALADADADVDRAWDRTRGTPSTVVADLDTGYRFDHPDLVAVAWDNPADPAGGGDGDGNGIVDDAHGADFVGRNADAPALDGDPTDDDLLDGGHGVHTAGTIGAAGNDGIGITGVAQDVRIMPLRVCGYSATASETRCPLSSQIQAINYAGRHGARVANLSLGGTAFNSAARNAFAANPGTLFVISAGNDAQDNELVPHYPCAYDPSTSGVGGAIDNIVCVAATDQADRLAGFSDWGARSVDLAAPGTEILSTYPWAQHVGESFEADDFAAEWIATGPDGGFARTNEAPLTSFGMADSPGAPPAAFSVRETTSAGVTIPAGYTRCTLEQTRVLSLGVGATYSYSVLLNGVPIVTSSPSASGSFALDLTGPALGAGGRLQLRFRYAAGVAPAAGDGAWLDDIAFTCPEPVGQTTGYAYLDGTSMAAPHVTGAAGLLFSLKPSATVAEVKSALLGSVDRLPSLAGLTVTGGRLNVADALEALVASGASPPPDTQLLSVPASGSTSTTATAAFRGVGDIQAASFECRLDGGTFAACASPATFQVPAGAHQLAVRARSKFGVVDPTPASAGWVVASVPQLQQPPPTAAVARCRVPRLKGKTLRRAKRALRRAHCRLGRVTKPRRPRSGSPVPLVVRSSKPRAGAVRAAGTRVALTLKPKPRPRRRP